MTPEQREEMAATLMRLPFVSWDRYVEHPGRLIAYGWIRRLDRRSDFVVLNFTVEDGELMVEPITSSAERSREIARLLHGTDDGHVDCSRVHGDLLPEKG